MEFFAFRLFNSTFSSGWCDPAGLDVYVLVHGTQLETEDWIQVVRFGRPLVIITDKKGCRLRPLVGPQGPIAQMQLQVAQWNGLLQFSLQKHHQANQQTWSFYLANCTPQQKQRLHLDELQNRSTIEDKNKSGLQYNENSERPQRQEPEGVRIIQQDSKKRLCSGHLYLTIPNSMIWALQWGPTDSEEMKSTRSRTSENKFLHLSKIERAEKV